MYYPNQHLACARQERKRERESESERGERELRICVTNADISHKTNQMT